MSRRLLFALSVPFLGVVLISSTPSEGAAQVDHDVSHSLDRTGQYNGALTLVGGCENCTEGTWYGEPVHFWHGPGGCDDPEQQGDSCQICESPHCGDPSVPHHGDCPGEGCDAETFFIPPSSSDPLRFAFIGHWFSKLPLAFGHCTSAAIQ